MYVLCMYATCVQAPGPGVIGSWVLSYMGAREWDSGPLGEQQLFLTAKLSLYTHIYVYIYLHINTVIYN